MSAPRSYGVSDAAVLALIGCALALGGFVRLWVGLAGALFGRGWPHAGAGDLFRVLERLPARLDAPATAWPSSARARLPGASGFYSALALLMGVTLVLALFVRRAASVFAGGRARGGGAALVISTDLDELLEISDRIAVLSRGRIVGVVDNEAGAAEQVGSLMVGDVQSEAAA